MSNWAKLQEELTGLPVHKRARHGIHFDKGGGEIVANFSGAPCHYLEKGLWKPIDTTPILLPDGWYGCAHSKVRVHPDGRVRVTGSDYQQFTKLPSAKAGKLSGDRIIRTFPGGEQHLIITEKGFRQEIRVDKPTFPLEKFIATRSGKLPSEFKESPLAAVDADGESYVFTGDVAAFGAWLDKAVYPVVIDPDFTAGANDLYITGTRDTSSSATFNEAYLWIGDYNTDFSNLRRTYLLFDTSSIDDGATITQVNLTLTAGVDLSGANFDVAIHKYDWSAFPSPFNDATKRETAWDGLLASAADSAIWRNTNGMSLNTPYTSGNLSTAWVSKTGTTYYGLMSSLDVSNTTGTQAAIRIHSSSYATAGHRPILTVLSAAAGVPKHFMHYQRLRSL